MQSVKEFKEKVQLNREEEQGKRYETYQEHRECLEVKELEESERFRVDNLMTGGVYFVKHEGKELNCDCPDYQHRCKGYTPVLKCKHILAVERWQDWNAKKKARRDGIHNFEPQKHLIKIKGNDYLEVKYRLHWFRLENFYWDIHTEVVQLDIEKGYAVVRADIFDEKGNHKASGLKMEHRKNFEDYAEKAETGAIGRALANLGYGSLQCFDLEEGIEKGRIADAPVSMKGNGENGKSLEIKPIQEKVGHNGVNGSNGSAKATMRQVQYLGDLCKELELKPAISIASLSREKASQYIEDLQKELNLRKKKK